MMKHELVRYDAYKDSGIEWLGEVPKQWELKRLKELAKIQNSNVDKKSHENEISVRLCNYVDVYKNEFIDSSLDFMQATADESEIKRFTIKKSDVLITKDSETCDDIAVPALATQTFEGVVCGYHLAQFRTKEKMLLGSYLFRLFQSKSYGFRFVISAKGITRVGLGQSAIADSLTPVPPLSEQKTIADYLYTKTAHIDRKIDLLTQKAIQYGKLKQSLINETVTRGLDKSVAMKDSGIEWIGEMPEHWEIKRVKDELENLDYKRMPLSGEVRGQMTEQVFDYYGASGVIDKVESYIFDEPLILIGEDGANLLMRNSPLAFIARGKYWVNNHAHILRPKKGSLHFLCYLLEAFDYTILISGSAQPKLTAGNLNSVLLMIPPISEQQAIADYLDTKTVHIDNIVTTINTQIYKLKELRKILINDVVTGKIKVS